MTTVWAVAGCDTDSVDLEALRERLGDDFAVTTTAPRVVRRTALDTFDRRLARAGRGLVHLSETRDERLELTTGEQTRVAGLDGGSPSWPAMAAALPPGTLRDEVARLTGIRALMVVEDGRRLVRRAEVRNSDRKIVVRLEIDEPAEDGDTPTTRVTVRPLRGYEKEARRVERLLTASLGPHAATAPTSVEPPAPLHVDPVVPAPALLALELAEFLAAMRNNLPGIVADVDTEFLHDFRVAVRRTRSTLKLGRPALPADIRLAWEPRFKWLGDLTTPVRDLDVYELQLPLMGSWLVSAQPEDLAPFAAHLQQKRAAARRTLLRGLRSREFADLLDGWERQVAAIDDRLADSTPSAAALAAASLQRSYRRVVRDGGAVTDASPAAALHDLRKRCKEMRYALEVFAPVLDDDDRAKAVSALKGLQDVLGRFQDSEVQRNTLRAFADEMVGAGAPAAALLAMGELVGHLDLEQQRARAEFSAAFARFTRPTNERRMRRLYRLPVTSRARP